MIYEDKFLKPLANEEEPGSPEGEEGEEEIE